MQLEEAIRAIDGIGRLARLDPTGNTGFGRDIAACRRSFMAYAVTAPVFILVIAVMVAGIPTTTPGVLAITEILATLIQIAGFPIILIPLLKIYGCADRWAWFITGYNWFIVAQNAIYLAMIGLWMGPLAALGVWPILLFQLYLYVIEAFLAETILAIGGWRAGSIVLLDALFSYGVDHVARWIGSGNFF